MLFEMLWPSSASNNEFPKDNDHFLTFDFDTLENGMNMALATELDTPLRITTEPEGRTPYNPEENPIVGNCYLVKMRIEGFWVIV